MKISKTNKLVAKLPIIDATLNIALIGVLISLVIFSVFSIILLLLDNLSWFPLLLLSVPVLVMAMFFLGRLYLKYSDVFSPSVYRVERIICFAMLIVGISLWGFVNMKNASEHIFINRDPGVYTLGALHLSQNNDLNISSKNEFGKDTFVSSSAVGVSEVDDSEMYLQGSHLLPALIGLGGRVVGSHNIYHLNVVFGITALLAIFFFALRIVRPIWALAAVGCMAASMPLIYFSRDMYTEPLAATFTFTGLGMMWLAFQSRSRLLWSLAGLAVGAAALTRIDGFLSIGAALVFTGCYVAFAKKSDRRSKLIESAYFVGGVTVTGILGWLDLYLLSSGYFFDLYSHFMLEMLVIALALIGGAVLSWVAWNTGLLKTIDKSLRKKYGLIITYIALIVVLLLATRQFWGPALGVVGGDNDELAGLWLGWYLGDVLVTLGVIGAALSIFWAASKGSIIYLIPVTAVLAIAALYMVKTAIAPDQVWASRRLLPVIMPGVVVFAFLAIQVISEKVTPYLKSSSKMAIYGIYIGVAALLIVQPLIISRPMIPHAQYTQLAVLEGFCDKLPSNSGVVWLGIANQWAVQATEEVCKVPSAGLASENVNEEALVDIENSLRKHGKIPVIAIFNTDYSPSENLLSQKGYRQPLNDSQKQEFTLASTGVFNVMENPVTRTPELINTVQMDIYHAYVENGKFKRVATK